MIKKLVKAMLSDVRRIIIGAIVLGLLGGTTGILYLSKTALDISIVVLTSSTPLWATIFLVLTCCLYTYFKLQQHQKLDKPPTTKEELREEFGVYWNNQYKLRCLKCKWPLKNSSKVHDSSIFFCSNCNTKFILRDPKGLFLTEAQAIEQLKIFPTSGTETSIKLENS